MAGGSPRHSEAGTRFAAATIARLKGNNCGVFNSDLRINEGCESLYTYPDVSMVCGQLELGDLQTLTNPTVLVEVLSPSTEGSDRGPKLERYQHMSSLREYVLISQEKPRARDFRSRTRWNLALPIDCGFECKCEARLCWHKDSLGEDLRGCHVPRLVHY